MTKLDINDDNVVYEELTLEEARDPDDHVISKITDALDITQAIVHSKRAKVAYLVIEIKG